MCLTHITCTKSVHQTLANLQHDWRFKEPPSGSPLGYQHKALKMGCCMMSTITTTHLCSEYQIWVSFTTQMMYLAVWNSPGTLPLAALLRSQRKMTELSHLSACYTSTICYRMHDTSVHLYIYLLYGNSRAQIENYSPTWLLQVATYLHVEETFILYIIYRTGAKQRLRCGYTAAIFCVYKVSCVDWVGNFINFEPSKFGYYLVNFIAFKIPNYPASRYIYTGRDNYLNLLIWTYLYIN